MPTRVKSITGSISWPDGAGRKLIIEVQSQRESDYMERLLFGTAKVVENLVFGADYSRIAKVISISILYFNLGMGDDYVYHGTTEFRGCIPHRGGDLKNLRRCFPLNRSYP